MSCCFCTVLTHRTCQRSWAPSPGWLGRCRRTLNTTRTCGTGCSSGTNYRTNSKKKQEKKVESWQCIRNVLFSCDNVSFPRRSVLCRWMCSLSSTRGLTLWWVIGGAVWLFLTNMMHPSPLITLPLLCSWQTKWEKPYRWWRVRWSSLWPTTCSPFTWACRPSTKTRLSYRRGQRSSHSHHMISEGI